MIIHRSLMLQASLLLPYINQMIHLSINHLLWCEELNFFARAVNGKFCHQTKSAIQIVSGNLLHSRSNNVPNSK